MKSRPILFSGPMVRALIAGTKTKARRIMKVQPSSVEYHLHGDASDSQNGMPTMRDEAGQGWSMCGPFKCPYITDGVFAGERGELLNARMGDVSDNKSMLWVKETARCSARGERPPDGTGYLNVEYRSGGESKTHSYDLVNRSLFPGFPKKSHSKGGRRLWNPAIFLPRWASRITLEITNVRVERLQEISEADAKAEGVDGESLLRMGFDGCVYRARFRSLWESLNGPGSWDLNPYVWVIEFKRTPA